MEIINDSTLKLMEQGDTAISLSKKKDIIVLLGLSGAGKTTVGLILTNDKTLNSVQTSPGVHVIVDNNGKISSRTDPLTSKTIFPDMMEDPGTETVFYDCPGFRDTRNSSMEIVNTFFMKKILSHARRMKLVFIVDHNVLSTRTGFPHLLHHATHLIKDVDKFKDGIGMIFNKVENIYEINDDTTQTRFVTNHEIITGIVEFLNIVTRTNELRENSGKSDVRLTPEMIKLVDFIKTKRGEEYPRISIIRVPNKEGPLVNIPIVQNTKNLTMEMIHENLKYVPSNPDDFGYTISKETEEGIVKMMTNIVQQFGSKVQDSLKLMENYYTNKQNRTFDIGTFDKNLESILTKVMKILEDNQSSTTFGGLSGDIEQLLGEIDIGLSKDDIAVLKRQVKQLKVLQLVNPDGGSTEKYYNSLLSFPKGIQQNIQELKNWTSFFIRLEKNLASPERINHPPSNYEQLKNLINVIIENKGSYKVKDLNDFLEQMSLDYAPIKNSVISPANARILNEILRATLSKPDSSCYQLTKLQVNGVYLKLSDVMALPKCPAGTDVIEIYAAKKLWIDVDIEEPSLSIVIVASTVEIVGEKKITLDGLPGIAHSNPKATNGQDGISTSENGTPGENGAPGLPGGNGGNLYVIAQNGIRNGKVEISVKGGDGSAGQDGGNGGNGAKGLNGDDPNLSNYEIFQNSTFYNADIPYIIEKYESLGDVGGKGGSGGNGGTGGLGGLAGEFHIYAQLFNCNMIANSSKNGTDGKHGSGGQGGLQGPDGDGAEKTTTIFDHSSTIQQSTVYDYFNATNTDLKVAPSGLAGGPNAPRENPEPENVVLHSLRTFKDYVNRIRSQFLGVEIPIAGTNLPEGFGNRRRRDVNSVGASSVEPMLVNSTYYEIPHEVPQLQIGHDAGYNSSRTSGVDAQMNVHPNLVLMDLILRNFTKVEPLSGNARNVSEPLARGASLEPVILTEEFARWLVNLCRPQDESTFHTNIDPISMIQHLKKPIEENRRDEIYRILYNHAVDAVPGLAIDIDDVKGKFEPLLI